MTTHFKALAESARGGVEAFLQVDRQTLVEATRAQLQEHWAAVRARHAAGESGANVLRALTAGADHVVRVIVDFGLATIPKRRQLLSRVSVCALGGYGRAELSPCSDLDICLLYEGPFDSDLEALNSFLVPFLWDIGFKTGYALHSVTEAYDLARTDPEVYTTYGQARLLHGSNSSFSRLKLLLAGLRNQPVAESVLKMSRRRERPIELHESYRDLYASEPNLKESLGGLRDYHSALWMINLQLGQLTIDDLARLGYISADEHLELVEGLDFLWRVRNEIHFHYQKADNTLTYAVQQHLAAAFGYGAASQSAIARLMQDYYAAARRVRGFLRIAERICHHEEIVVFEPAEGEVAVGIEVRDGRLYAGANDPNWFAESPPRLMEAFWASVRRNVPISTATESAIRENLYLVNDAFQSSDIVRSLFLAICRRPLQAGSALRQMASCGLLGLYLPEFGAVGGIVRYEDFHSYPVDEHTLRAVEAIQNVYQIQGNVGRVLQKTLEHLREPHALILALICHDLGKVDGEEHVEEGVRLVASISARVGLSEEDTDLVSFLVRHHMVMTHTSMYRDIDDPELVVQFAETMQSVERLRHLLLLSYADLSAVGPNVWTEWKGALLLKLFLRAERHLIGRTTDEPEEFWRQPKAVAVSELAPEAHRENVEAHLKGLGDRYFYAFPAETIAGHLACIEEARERGLSVTAVNNPEHGSTEVTIVTRDRHGLFAAIAGGFASHLIDVRGAMLFTTPDGLVLDVFLVVDASTQKALTEAQVGAVRRVLEAVLLEGQDVQHFVEQSRKRLFALLQPRAPVPTSIDFDNSVSRTDTIIDVQTGDRTGLLYDMARALADLGVDFVSARIVTDARRARDSFSVRLNDKKIEDVETQQNIREGLAAAIAPWAMAQV